jgi:hypothetical protein
MTVQPLSSPDAAAATTAAKQVAKTRASFAGALAKASSKSAADTPDSVLDAKKAPKGETSKPVKGHAYADILSGPRNGYYVSLAPGERQGKAFLIQHKDGKTYHVYGSGKNKEWVHVPTDPSALKPPKGETWGPVDGHSDYADILSGPRNGYYVSLAPGKRQGKAFLIQHKDGKTYHVYGTGAKKEWVRVATDPNSLTPPKGETWKAVDHHKDYKQISGGKRDDMFMNLSGNARTGEAFKIVERDGRRYHVYGSGKDVREVAVGGHAKKTDS